MESDLLRSRVSHEISTKWRRGSDEVVTTVVAEGALTTSGDIVDELNEGRWESTWNPRVRVLFWVSSE